MIETTDNGRRTTDNRPLGVLWMVALIFLLLGGCLWGQTRTQVTVKKDGSEVAPTNIWSANAQKIADVVGPLIGGGGGSGDVTTPQLNNASNVVVALVTNRVAPNIAALRASGVTNEVTSLGYYAPGDGGGGVFFFDATSSDSTNRGTVLAHSSGNGRWKRIREGFLSVRAFGAYGDLVQTTMSIASNSIYATNATGLTTADIGKTCQIFGAAITNEDLTATITNVIGTNVAVLNTIASNTVVGAAATIGHDDTTAIQDALNIGGKVLIPAGTYGLMATNFLTSTALGGFTVLPALTIGRDNVEVIGMDRPKLHVLGGFRRLPDTSVQRSAGIQILSVSNVVLSGLEIYGGLNGYTGNYGYPADYLGDGWDVTHKGLLLTVGTPDNIVIQDCHVHDWRGEMFYAGIETSRRVIIRNCHFETCNASLFNLGGNIEVSGSLFNSATLGTEFGQQNSGGGSYVHGNVFSNIAQIAFVVSCVRTNTSNPLRISQNVFVNNAKAIEMGNGKDITIDHNQFIQNVAAFEISSSGLQCTQPTCTNITFDGNTIVSTNAGLGIALSGAIVDSRFSGNTFKGLGNEYAAVEYYGGISNVIFSENWFFDNGPGQASTLAWDYPLFLNNHYGRRILGRPIVDNYGADGDPMFMTYSVAEQALLFAVTGLHPVYINPAQVPDGAVIRINLFSPSPDVVYSFQTTSTNIFPRKRYLRDEGDELVVKFNRQANEWREVSYTPGAWKSAATAPASGLWITGEEVFSTTTNQASFVCIQGGSPGVWATNYGAWNAVLINNGFAQDLLADSLNATGAVTTFSSPMKLNKIDAGAFEEDWRIESTTYWKLLTGTSYINWKDAASDTDIFGWVKSPFGEVGIHFDPTPGAGTTNNGTLYLADANGSTNLHYLIQSSISDLGGDIATHSLQIGNLQAATNTFIPKTGGGGTNNIFVASTNRSATFQASNYDLTTPPPLTVVDPDGAEMLTAHAAGSFSFFGASPGDDYGNIWYQKNLRLFWEGDTPGNVVAEIYQSNGLSIKSNDKIEVNAPNGILFLTPGINALASIYAAGDGIIAFSDWNRIASSPISVTNWIFATWSTNGHGDITNSQWMELAGDSKLGTIALRSMASIGTNSRPLTLGVGTNPSLIIGTNRELTVVVDSFFGGNMIVSNELTVASSAAFQGGATVSGGALNSGSINAGTTNVEGTLASHATSIGNLNANSNRVYNGEISKTNSSHVGLVADSINNTNRLRSVSSGYGMLTTNEGGTNISFAVDSSVIASQSDVAPKQTGFASLSNLAGLASSVFTNVPKGGTNISMRTVGGTNFFDIFGNLNDWAQLPTNQVTGTGATVQSNAPTINALTGLSPVFKSSIGSTTSPFQIFDTNGLPLMSVLTNDSGNFVIQMGTNGNGLTISNTPTPGIVYFTVSNKVIARINGATQRFTVGDPAGVNFSLGPTAIEFGFGVQTLNYGSIANSGGISINAANNASDVILASNGVAKVRTSAAGVCLGQTAHTPQLALEVTNGITQILAQFFQHGTTNDVQQWFNETTRIAALSTNGNLALGGMVLLKAQSSTNTPPAGNAGLFSATNSTITELFAIDSSGNVTQLSSHPLDAPPGFYVVTNWISGAPDITRTLKMYSGTIEWENKSLEALKSKWEFDRDLGTTNFFTTLTAGQKLLLRSAMHRIETFASYNARMGFTNAGDSRALLQWDWAGIQNSRQADYDAARALEQAAFDAGYTNIVSVTNLDLSVTVTTNIWPKNSNVVVRAAADIREPKPALVDWIAPN